FSALTRCGRSDHLPHRAAGAASLLVLGLAVVLLLVVIGGRRLLAVLRLVLGGVLLPEPGVALEAARLHPVVLAPVPLGLLGLPVLLAAQVAHLLRQAVLVAPPPAVVARLRVAAVLGDRLVLVGVLPLAALVVLLAAPGHDQGKCREQHKRGATPRQE